MRSSSEVSISSDSFPLSGTLNIRLSDWKRLRDSHMTTKMKIELVDRGMEMLMNDTPPGTVYTEELMEEANRIKNAQRVLLGS